MSYASLENISISYDRGKTYVLEDFNLSVREGELLSLLGPSGCGKSTTLRAIAGFVPIEEGSFYLEGKAMEKVPVHDRDFGFVFQNYALFPHMTVYENVAFGLKMRNLSDEAIEKEVLSMLEIVDILAYRDRYPSQLSGGQRQRVALARALVIKPKLLLLDEPLSNLDAKLRLQMRHEIRRIQKQLGITTIFVTHDQEECFAISDRVALMRDGQIEQLSTPQEMYHYPKTSYVADFVGFENIYEKEGVIYCIRAEDIHVHDKGTQTGIVKSKEFLGQVYRLSVETDGHELLLHTKKDCALGSKISFDLDLKQVRKVEASK